LCLTPLSSTSLFTLSLHDALPIFHGNNGNASLNDLFLPKNFVKITTIVNGINVPANRSSAAICIPTSLKSAISASGKLLKPTTRSEEHTSELQSRFDIVCRLLLEK